MALVRVSDSRPLRIEVAHGDVVDFEVKRAVVLQPGCYQVLHDLLLAVDPDRATRQLLHVDAVRPLGRTQVNPAVVHALTLQPLADAGLDHQVDGVLFEQPGAHTLLEVVAVARLQDHRLDALAVEQVGEHQPGRPGTDDAYLGTHPTRLDWWWRSDGRGTQDLRPRLGDTYVVCARSRDAPAARLRAVQVDRTAPPEAAADLPAAEHH